MHLTEGGEGFDFLGFHHRLVRPRAVARTGGLVYLARWPSRKAAQHARDRIRLLTMRARLAAPVDQIVQEVNAFLRGWAGFFRYGLSASAFDKIRTYAVLRVALFVSTRHQRGRSWGFAQVYRFTGQPGADLPQWNRRRPQAEPALAGSGLIAG